MAGKLAEFRNQKHLSFWATIPLKKVASITEIKWHFFLTSSFYYYFYVWNRQLNITLKVGIYIAAQIYQMQQKWNKSKTVFRRELSRKSIYMTTEKNS